MPTSPLSRSADERHRAALPPLRNQPRKEVPDSCASHSLAKLEALEAGLDPDCCAVARHRCDGPLVELAGLALPALVAFAEALASADGVLVTLPGALSESDRLADARRRVEQVRVLRDVYESWGNQAGVARMKEEMALRERSLNAARRVALSFEARFDVSSLRAALSQAAWGGDDWCLCGDGVSVAIGPLVLRVGGDQRRDAGATLLCSTVEGTVRLGPIPVPRRPIEHGQKVARGGVVG